MCAGEQVSTVEVRIASHFNARNFSQTHPMKLYIMTDMEGVAGVLNQADYERPGARYYETARELTTGEVNAAIEGALEAGVTEILVADGHGYGAINPQLLHPAAKLLAGKPVGYPFGCDASFDAAFSIGQHAKSNADGGHLSHTGSFNCEEKTINGLSVGELGCNMLFCGYFGVPMVFVSGDEACAHEAQALVPTIETVAVKSGLKRGSASGLSEDKNRLFNGAAIHLSPQIARDAIRAGAKRALERRHEIQPFTIVPPYEMIWTLRADDNTPTRRGCVRAQDALQLLQTPPQFKEIG